jgi:hypothetical protein
MICVEIAPNHNAFNGRYSSSDHVPIWIVDVHRDNGKKFVVRSDEQLTAFLELKSDMRPYGELV